MSAKSSLEEDDDIERDFDVLPVEDFRQEILDTVAAHQIVICIGETGSGKTTQIPKFFLEAGLLGNGLMAVTQPRRIAAITVAKRVSEECKCPIGDKIGYNVRFDDMTTTATKIKYMTDGILIRECLSDRNLPQYSYIMIDEAHERSLNTDILFGLLKAACKNRPNLKVIITSATLDADKFSAYFHSCPVIHIPGRTFPVDVYHSKTKQIMTINGPANQSYIQSCVDLVLKIHTKEIDGHILVFLTGQEEIEKACHLIQQAIQTKKTDNPHAFEHEIIVLPLYAALSNEDQMKIFQKPEVILAGQRHKHHHNRSHPSHSLAQTTKFIRKCVVATNIAETSITVPHVRFVIDAGFVKQKVYDPSRGMESLIVVPTSKIAALQRAGRAGRTGPGQCYRLYSSESFDDMMDETVPEIQRTNLANTILYLKAIGINNILAFDFLDPPSAEQVLQALTELYSLQALNKLGEITPIGRKMSTFPLDPHFSRMLIESVCHPACQFAGSSTSASGGGSCNKSKGPVPTIGCWQDMIIICAMLSVENIWHRPRGIRGGEGMNRSHGRPTPADGGSQQPPGFSSRLQFHAKGWHKPIPNQNPYEPTNSSDAPSSSTGYQARVLSAEEERCEIAYAGFRHEYGDLLTYWNVFVQWEAAGCTYEWCERHFINFRSMKMARKIREHLHSEVQQARLHEFQAEYLRSYLRASLPPSTSTSTSTSSSSEVSSPNPAVTIKPHTTLAKCLAHAIASGYYMNAAMKCVNESVYKLLPLPLPSTVQPPDIQLVHIHPQSAFAHITPSEHVVYQDILQNTKLFIRHVSKVSEKMLQEYRQAYQALDPHYLSQDDELIALAKEKEQQALIAAQQAKTEEEARKKRLREMLEEETREGQVLEANKRSKLELQHLQANAGKLSAIEQAKLRYLSRKK